MIQVIFGYLLCVALDAMGIIAFHHTLESCRGAEWIVRVAQSRLTIRRVLKHIGESIVPAQHQMSEALVCDMPHIVKLGVTVVELSSVTSAALKRYIAPGGQISTDSSRY